MLSRCNNSPVNQQTFNKGYIVLFILILTACTQTTVNESIPIQVECTVASLITAINDANQDPDPTTLVMEENCEIYFNNPDNFDGPGAWNALPQVISPITIIGKGSLLTKLQPEQFRFFAVSSQGNLRLEDLILENGYAIIGAGGDYGPGGGAIVNDGGVLILHSVTLRDNFGVNGGAVWSSGTLVIEEGTSFENNRSGRGGAIFLSSSAGIPISITDTAFLRNSADPYSSVGDGYGGVIYIQGTDGAGLQISDSEMWGSATGNGGVIYSEDTEGEVFLYNVDLGGRADQDGGVIYMTEGEVTLENSSVAYGTAGESGGAFFVESGLLIFSGSEVDSGHAGYEGGILINQDGEVRISGSRLMLGRTAGPPDDMNVPSFGGCISNYETLVINNSTISSCQSYAGGGLINHTQANAVLTNVTMFANWAYPEGMGGQIYNRGNLDLNFVTMHLPNSCCYSNTVIYIHGGNTRVKDSILNAQTYGEASALKCVVDAGSFETYGNDKAYGIDCPGFYKILASLVISSSSGFHFDPSGPAPDSARNCQDLNDNFVATDQLGVSRPQPTSGSCDIGAIELPQLPGPPPPTPQIMPRLSTPDNLSCREGDSNDYPVAGYLMAGESAEVIGQNYTGTWLVINNPDWEGICWLFEGNVDLEGSLEGVAVLTAPPLSEVEEEGGDGGDNTSKQEEGGDGSDNTSKPACKGSLEAEECKQAGGTYNIQNLPACKCP